ncbi:ABC transporter ATP-binding protein [Pyrobaculum neutrophilum]|uniref:ABC transporter related n=1 Tax=Pyrobaculum neutrophilum (strain DSM 2338 / JCM 9278 / NBRC 100436 / V24Sta) TaxID=444157 RepID=B1YE09_PYRNV|nr:ABC transporter ATP-binding protein [Pyrobaculum neutrophilum]ACB40022.1 ABC transporter related [Pyrobaculum neutrophilum V24Sta]
MYVEFDVEKRLGGFLLRASGRLEPGVTCVVGPNGSGKTTLLKILAGLLKPDGGWVKYVGVSSRVYVGDLHVPPDAPAGEVVLSGRSRFSPRPVERGDVEAARRYMEALGVLGLAGRRWSTLSGGERQRFVIAAALASEADLLLLDEPLSNLHGDWRGRAMRVLGEYSSGRIVVVTTHHLDVLGCCRWVYALREGSVAWRGEASGYRPEVEEACRGTKN